MSLLETNTIKHEQVDKNIIKLEFKINNNKIYQIKKIQDSAVYIKESKTGHLLGLYYLIDWKSYPKKENIWKLALILSIFKSCLASFIKRTLPSP